MMTRRPVVVRAVVCPMEACGYTVFSRAPHDYRACPCGSVAIDGGLNYARVSHAEGLHLETIEITVDASRKDLYDDWNLRTDRLGRIPPASPVGCTNAPDPLRS
jgi:hypothetical protein